VFLEGEKRRKKITARGGKGEERAQGKEKNIGFLLGLRILGGED
jgi:hypothetical protein